MKTKKEKDWIIKCTEEETESVFVDIDILNALMDVIGERVRDNEVHAKEFGLYPLILVAREKIENIEKTLLK